MKAKFLLGLIVLLVFMSMSAFSQECLSGGCTVSSSQWPTTTQATSSSTFSTISTAMYAGDYAVCDVTAGNTYEWSMCLADGGATLPYDPQLTLFDDANTTTPLCFSDDYCGSYPKIGWTATFTGQIRIQITEYASGGCLTNTTFSTLVWRCISSSSGDATVSNVYTMGTVASPTSNPHVVRALITNSGLTTLTNLAVSLNVSGANSFNNTQNIASLTSGATSIVTFAGYSSSATGTNTVTVSVPSDLNNADNSQSVTQTVTTNSANYAYGTISTGGAGFNSITGEVASKFYTGTPTTVSAVKVNFFTGGESYKVKLWDASGAGTTPGTLLYTSGLLTASAGVTSVSISPAVSVSGNFFVGVEQVNTTNFNLAVQDEIPVRPGSFYSYTSGTGVWTDLSPGSDFRMMVEPVYTAPATCSITIPTGAIAETETCGLDQNGGCNMTTPTYQNISLCQTIRGTAYASGGTRDTDWFRFSLTSASTVTMTATAEFPFLLHFIDISNCALPTSLTNITGDACTTQSITYSFPIGNFVAFISDTGFYNRPCSASSDYYFTLSLPAPSTPGAISGPTSVCPNQAGVLYSISPVANATSYTWTVPAGATINSGQGANSISVTFGSTGGNVTVTANNSCNSPSSPNSLAVTVSGTPSTPGPISGATSICPNQTGVFYSITALPGSNTYTWSVPFGAIITSGQGSTAIMVNFGALAGTISVTAGNSCGTSAASTLTVNTNGTTPSTPGSITGLTSICPTQTGVSYSISPVSGASSYTWSVTNGASITSGQGTTTINVSFGAGGSTISVTATNACGTSGISSLVVLADGTVPAAPSAITGTTSLCPGQTNISYSVAPVTGAFTYTWTVPSGSSITSGQGSTSILITFGGTAGNVTVTAGNACGTSTATILAIDNTGTTPATPGTISGPASVCPNASGVSYSVASVPGAFTYTWTVPSGATIASGQGTSGITVNFGSNAGSITVTSGNACGTSAANSLLISLNPAAPSTPGTITGPLEVCEHSTATFSIAAVTNASTYTWSGPSGATVSAGQGTVSADITFGSATGNVTVTAGNSCGTSASSTWNVIVNPNPPVPTVSMLGNVLTSSASSGNQWMLNGNPITGATSQTYTVTQNGTYEVTVTNNKGCNSTSSTLVVTTTGIQANPDVYTKMTLYPNPFTDHVTLSFLSDGTSVEKLEVYDLLGNIQKMIPLNEPKKGLTVLHLTAAAMGISEGVYFIRHTNSTGKETQKLILLK